MDIFNSLDINCTDWSIGQSSITPYYDHSTKHCHGLIEQKEVDCQSTPNEDQQRLCKCVEKSELYFNFNFFNLGELILVVIVLANFDIL